MKLLNLFNRKKRELSEDNKDELCGEWTTSDGSGFYGIMGSWMIIRPNGTGNYESWSNSGEDNSYNYSGEFNWERIDKNKIAFNESDTESIEIIEYDLSVMNGSKELTSLQPELSKVKIESFWNFAQVMYNK
jgi:hypothetical protein